MNNCARTGPGPLAIITLMLSMLLSSCQQNDTEVAVPKTITDQILEDSQFSLLRAAIQHADVGDALKAGNLTLFAPNDAAFQASGLGSASAITTLPKEQVRSLVLYHTLYASVASSALPQGLNSVETASRGVAFVNKTTTGTLFINNAQVTQPDLPTANGLIHVIDRVLTPSTGTILATIQANPNLTLLSAALRRVSQANPTLLTALNNSSSTNPVTIFAPTDAAFRADGRFGTLAAIETANPQTLANALLYHVVSGVVFSNQLQTGTINTLLNNTRLNLVVSTSQITVRGARNTTAAVVQTPNLPATNGVVHTIDQVLLP
ncbi:putative surface protein with fasciclin (FAS1) repeats [Spirosoma lacussanchae]|uniref:fasciclin domain-containing protein n=1 Tax=Spirosoma lacussanchae TaxID=1884249 RepID=UPI0011080B2D|nr:fasciclin domain-containing protein [Spirosoma lacussanchae]